MLLVQCVHCAAYQKCFYVGVFLQANEVFVVQRNLFITHNSACLDKQGRSDTRAL